jgi:uncharacterized protein (DUF362 family)
MGAVLDKGRHARNLYKIAKLIPVHLAIIDGWRGMEGNGPVKGTEVHSRVGVASTDFIAADVVGTLLMGFDPSDIGYLQYSVGNYGFSPLGIGVFSEIILVGEQINDVRRIFVPHNSHSAQKNWRISPDILKNVIDSI